MWPQYVYGHNKQIMKDRKHHDLTFVARCQNQKMPREKCDPKWHSTTKIFELTMMIYIRFTGRNFIFVNCVYKLGFITFISEKETRLKFGTEKKTQLQNDIALWLKILILFWLINDDKFNSGNMITVHICKLTDTSIT